MRGDERVVRTDLRDSFYYGRDIFAQHIQKCVRVKIRIDDLFFGKARIEITAPRLENARKRIGHDVIFDLRFAMRYLYFNHRK